MTTDNWDAARDQVASRMAELGLKQADIARRTNLSRETLRPILQGRPGNYRPTTLAAVSQALGWPPDGIERALAGQDPMAQRSALEERLEELARRVEALERKNS